MTLGSGSIPPVDFYTYVMYNNYILHHEQVSVIMMNTNDTEDSEDTVVQLLKYGRCNGVGCNGNGISQEHTHARLKLTYIMI